MPCHPGSYRIYAQSELLVCLPRVARAEEVNARLNAVRRVLQLLLLSAVVLKHLLYVLQEQAEPEIMTLTRTSYGSAFT